MAISDDFLLDPIKRIISYVGAAGTTYSCNDFFVYTDDLSDDADQRLVDPSMDNEGTLTYKLINGWFMNPEAVPHLTGYEADKPGGTLATVGWLDEIHRVSFAATAGAISTDIGKPVTSAGGAFGTLVGYSSDGKTWYVRTGSATVSPSGSAMLVTGGTGSGTSNADSVTGECQWTNAYTLGAIEAGTEIYPIQNGVKMTGFLAGYTSGHWDALLLVKDFGVVIDSGNITAYARKSGDTFTFYNAGSLLGGGRVPIPLQTEDDKEDDGTGSGVAGVTFDFVGPFTADVNEDASDETYTYKILAGGNNGADLYKYLKYICDENSSFDVDGTPGHQYLSANPAYLPIVKAPFGTYSGGTFFGARGVLVTGLSTPYQLIDNAGNSVVPPSTVSISAPELVIGDSVTAYLVDGNDDVIYSQYTLNGAHSIGGNTITLNEAPDFETPNAGYIRIWDAAASPYPKFDLYEYSSRAGSVFTLSGTLTANYSTGAPLFIPFLDVVAVGTQVSNSFKFSADFRVKYSVRQHGSMKPFIGVGTVDNTGLKITPTRIPNPVVT